MILPRLPFPQKVGPDGLFSNSVKITVRPDISGTWVVLSELLLKGILTKTPSQPARHNECSAKPSAQLVLKTCLVVAVPATIFQKGSPPHLIQCTQIPRERSSRRAAMLGNRAKGWFGSMGLRTCCLTKSSLCFLRFFSLYCSWSFKKEEKYILT